MAFYHETYNVVQGQSENIYINMPEFGLGKAYDIEVVDKETQSASMRLKQAKRRK